MLKEQIAETWTRPKSTRRRRVIENLPPSSSVPVHEYTPVIQFPSTYGLDVMHSSGTHVAPTMKNDIPPSSAIAAPCEPGHIYIGMAAAPLGAFATSSYGFSDYRYMRNPYIGSQAIASSSSSDVIPQSMPFEYPDLSSSMCFTMSMPPYFDDDYFAKLASLDSEFADPTLAIPPASMIADTPMSPNSEEYPGTGYQTYF